MTPQRTPILKDEGIRRFITPAGSQSPNLDAELMICAAKILSFPASFSQQIDLDEMYFRAQQRIEEQQPNQRSAEHMARIRDLALATCEFIRKIEALGI